MFALVWMDEAFEDMDQIVRENPGRTAELALALRDLTTRLASNPGNVGESRDEDDVRVMFTGPLTVFFRVDEEDKVVEIGRIRLHG